MMNRLLGRSSQRDDSKKVKGFISPTDTYSALANKLVSDTDTENTVREVVAGESKAPAHQSSHINEAMMKAATSRATAHNIQQNLPDVELAKQILVTSIISPNDLVSTEIFFNLDDSNDYLGTAGKSMLKSVEDTMKKHFKIEKCLQPYLEASLFDDGSVPVIVLPESSLDHAINSGNIISKESIGDFISQSTGTVKSLGILINPKGDEGNDLYTQLTASIESISLNRPMVYDPKISDKMNITIIDNYEALKLPRLNEKIIHDRLATTYRKNQLGMELYNPERERSKHFGNKDKNVGSTGDINDRVKSVMSSFTERQYQTETVLNLKTKNKVDQETIGHPLVMRVPHESCIPIFPPSDPTNHIGYYVVIDNTGNPVRIPVDSDYIENMINANSDNTDMSDFLAQKVNQSQFGTNGNTAQKYDEMYKAFSKVIEEDLIIRLSGMYGGDLSLGATDEIYKLMFARALAKKHTQLIFVPKTLLTYFAFDYNDYGMGISLLEKSKMIASLRSVLMYANVMAAVKNSITQREVEIQLDPTDPNPDKTIEEYLHAVAKATRSESPFGEFDPLNIVSNLTNSGVSVSVSGHPGFPETKAVVNHSNVSMGKVDTELDEMLKKWHIMSMWLTPETVDAATGPDFATSVHANNILLAKRNQVAQDIYTDKWSDHIRKICYNSKPILDDLKKILEQNRKFVNKTFAKTYTDDEIINYFLMNIYVELPRAETAKFEMQLEALDQYTQALDKILTDAFLSTNILATDMIGEIGMTVDATREIVKAYYIRRYCKLNNIMPELFDMITVDNDNKTIVNMLDEHVEFTTTMSKALLGLMTKIKPIIKDNNALLEKLEETTGVKTEGDAGGFDAGDEGGGDGTDGDMGGDDLGLGFDDPSLTEGEGDGTEGDGTDEEDTGTEGDESNPEGEWNP
jgi:hypothetical protein